MLEDLLVAFFHEIKRCVISSRHYRAQLETELPNTRICSCYFHFCKSLCRRVSDLGVSTPYGRNRRLKKCIRKFIALAHLPVPLVRQIFGILSTARSTRRLINRYPALFDFIRYLENNYISGQYTIQRWNVYDVDIDTRTNNHVEGLYFLSRKISNWTQRAPESLGAGVAQWVRSLDLTAHISLLPIRRGFAPSFVNYKKGCTRLATASDKVYQLLAQGRWFSPDTPASSTT
jgi:hypothetical protein